MRMVDNQKELRLKFLGGFAGQLVSGVIWLISAAIAVLSRPTVAMAFLFIASMAIFPLTNLVLRLMGKPVQVDPANKLWGLGAQIAFTVPINYLLVGAATLHQQHWFFPASLIVVGAHYLPFITLYGMNMFAFLSALMVAAGIALVFTDIRSFSIGGWVGALLLLAFAFLGKRLVKKEMEQ